MAWIQRIIAFMTLLSLVVSITASKQVYIVHMDHNSKPDSFTTHRHWYASIIQSITSTPSYDSHIYTYNTAFHGFAAHLEPHEVDFLRELDSVIDVHEDRPYKVQTTRTPQFLGLGYHGADNYDFAELDEKSHHLVVEIVDSGIWPESRSFDDTGMSAVPKNWKGKCESAPDFDPKKHCNKKLIGARVFLDAYFKQNGRNETMYASPRDIDGHGTHTASIAVGSPVTDASFFGYAAGTARGMATRARLASYRVCWTSGTGEEYCSEADILKGMTKAVEDGVDVISASLGVIGVRQYYNDPIAKAAFTAMQMGVLVSCAAGNGGSEIIINVAPWITTVGVGSMDRSFPGYVSLGNGMSYLGFSISGEGRELWEKSQGQLLYPNGSNSNSGNLCLPGSLDSTQVRGKIVVCDINTTAIQTVQQGLAVKEAGGVGIILSNTAEAGELPLDGSSHVLPAVTMGQMVGDLIREYAVSDSNATATLYFGRTELDVKPSPVVAWYSSRGPNTITPQILKPDLIGPGVLILAAWPDTIPVTGLKEDTRRTQFNLISGTSMSTPHISGIAILLKAAHPNWSPSAIKSALMTTAYTMDNTNSPILDNFTGTYSTSLAHGSGYVNPRKAVSPGLVYNISKQDYITFLCSLNYTLQQVKSVVLDTNMTCSKRFSDPGQLNYPSFSVVFGDGKRVVRYTRELTNVGVARSVYDVVVDAPSSVKVTVKPTRLAFDKEGDRRKYTVTFVAQRKERPSSNFTFGSLVWSNKQHQVRSPIVCMWS